MNQGAVFTITGEDVGPVVPPLQGGFSVPQVEASFGALVPVALETVPLKDREYVGVEIDRSLSGGGKRREVDVLSKSGLVGVALPLSFISFGQ